jgi:hypothetical protein
MFNNNLKMFKNNNYLIYILIGLVLLAIYFSQKENFYGSQKKFKQDKETLKRYPPPSKYRFPELVTYTSNGVTFQTLFSIDTQVELRKLIRPMTVPMYYSPSHFGIQVVLITPNGWECYDTNDNKMYCTRKGDSKCCDSCGNNYICTIDNDYWWWEEYISIILTPVQAKKNFNLEYEPEFEKKLEKIMGKYKINLTNTTLHQM